MVGELDAARMLYDQGRALMDSGDLEASVERFRESSRIAPHFKTLELEGECLLKLGRVSEAVIPLAAASTLNKGVRAVSFLAEAFARLNEGDRCKEMCEEALRRDPSNKKAREIAESLTRAE